MNKELLEHIRVLGELLVEGPKLPNTVIEKVGAVRVVAGDTHYLTSSWAGVEEIRVSVDPEGDDVFNVSIEAELGTALLTVAEIKSLYGDFDVPPRVAWNRPVILLFKDITPNGPMWCNVSVELDGFTEDYENASARGVTFVVRSR